MMDPRRFAPLALTLALGCAPKTPPAPAAVAAAPQAPVEALAPVAAQEPPEAQAPDFEAALGLTAVRTADGATLELLIQPGFHLYGARETIGMPPVVEVDDHSELQVDLPEGERKELEGLGEAWVLTGEQALLVPLPLAQGPLQGVLVYQACTESLCSMPITRAWSAGD